MAVYLYFLDEGLHKEPSLGRIESLEVIIKLLQVATYGFSSDTIKTQVMDLSLSKG